MEEQMTILWDSVKNFWIEFSGFLPRLLGAALLLLVGWLVAKLLRKGIIKLLKLAKLDVAAKKAGIEEFLKPYNTIGVIGNVIYWLLLFTVVLAVLNSLKLQVAADLFNRVILYVPNVLVAILVIVFGVLFARFVQGALHSYLKSIEIRGAGFISDMARWAIVVFVAMTALEQLNIGGTILTSAFQLGFGALCLALALAFGLGGRDWAAKTLESAWAKRRPLDEPVVGDATDQEPSP